MAEGGWILIAFVVAVAAFMYFFGIRPTKKREKMKSDMMKRMSPGDFVLTTSGFYGEVVDAQEDVVIIEFGNNKNCRIAMKKDAIEQVERVSSEQDNMVFSTAKQKNPEKVASQVKEAEKKYEQAGKIFKKPQKKDDKAKTSDSSKTTK